MTTLQFSPFSSTILPEFWTSLTKLKIDELKLSQHPVPVKGVYHPGRRVLDRDTGAQLSLGTNITFDGDGLDGSPVASTS
jgi:ubiquitin-like modifier-activating enzyme ATG7